MQVQHPLAVVTPTLDGDILTVLALSDARFTAGRIGKLMPTRSYNGIRKALNRLADQGTVDVEQVGTIYSYTLNREHVAAAPIVALANLRGTLLNRIRAQIASWPIQPVYACVFGSTMRGQMRPDSDIDIFVVRPDSADRPAWEQQTGELATRVTRWTGNDGRALQMAESEVRAGVGGEPVLDDIAELAAGTVAGDPAWLRRIVSKGRGTRRGLGSDE